MTLGTNIHHVSGLKGFQGHGIIGPRSSKRSRAGAYR